MFDELERLLAAAWPDAPEGRSRAAAELVWRLWSGEPIGPLEREARAAFAPDPSAPSPER